MRRAARRDEGERLIIDGLRAVGVWVHSLNAKNIPDLLVGYRSRLILLEVKDGNKPPSRRKLRPGQRDLADQLKGFPVFKVESLDDAFRALGIMKS